MRICGQTTHLRGVTYQRIMTCAGRRGSRSRWVVGARSVVNAFTKKAPVVLLPSHSRDRVVVAAVLSPEYVKLCSQTNTWPRNAVHRAILRQRDGFTSNTSRRVTTRQTSQPDSSSSPLIAERSPPLIWEWEALQDTLRQYRNRTIRFPMSMSTGMRRRRDAAGLIETASGVQAAEHRARINEPG